MTLPEMPVLDGTHVRLEPLNHAHRDELARISDRDELSGLWYTFIPNGDGMTAEIDRRLGLYTSGSMMPFAVIDVTTGTPVGMTTFMNMRLDNKKVEIGSTWLAKSVHGTHINPEMKLLMLQYAFEVLECNAVELRTHEMNSQSRAAISKLGAKQDGLLRNDMVMPNGTLRNTAVYSITVDEWPEVRARLLDRIDA
ncbi:MAG: hypothetical protein RIS25_1216 [Actinomycetota bacterium]|jgi:RimJ/RimL family protein N-acetyltransferase